jgi:hypothetical protein
VNLAVCTEETNHLRLLSAIWSLRDCAAVAAFSGVTQMRYLPKEGRLIESHWNPRNRDLRVPENSEVGRRRQCNHMKKLAPHVTVLGMSSLFWIAPVSTARLSQRQEFSEQMLAQPQNILPFAETHCLIVVVGKPAG